MTGLDCIKLSRAAQRELVIAIALLLASSGCAAEIQLPSATSPDATMTQLPEAAPGAGREWRVVESPTLHEANLFAVMAMGDLLLAAGNQDGKGGIWTSVDGVEWEPAEPASAIEGALIWGLIPWEGGAMALGEEHSLDYRPPPVVLTSVDGRAWQESAIDACSHDFYNLSEAAVGDEALILVGSLGRQPGGGAVCRFSDEGSGLPDEGLFQGSLLSGVAVRGATVLVAGTKNSVGVPTDPAAAGAWVSIDHGQHFSEVQLAEGTGSAGGVISTDDGFLVVGADDGPAVWRSADGSTWERIKLGSTGAAYDLVRGAAGFVAVGDVSSGFDPSRAQVWLSADGIRWEAIDIPANEDVRVQAVAAWGGGYVAVGGDLVWLSP